MMNRFQTFFPYNTVRDEQQYILDEVDIAYKQNKKYILIEAGTGVGKSAIAKTLSAHAKNSYVLTATKQLQDQYEKDFYNKNCRSVKGRSNYPCIKADDMDCQTGLCKYNAKLKKQCGNQCPYVKARKQAEASEMFVTSYSYYLGKMAYRNEGQGSRNIIIIDEAHLLEQQLIHFAEVSLNKKNLMSKYKLEFDDVKEHLQFMGGIVNKYGSARSDKELFDWVKLVNKSLHRAYQTLSKELEQRINQDNKNVSVNVIANQGDIKSLSKKVTSLENLLEKLENILTTPQNNWIISADKDEVVKVQPDIVHDMFKKLIDNEAIQHVVFMSATILNVDSFCRDIGIDRNDVCVIRQDSTFNCKKSPIVYDPIGSMAYKSLNATLPYVYEEIKMILNKHKGEKGIIHTGNYAIMNKILENIDDSRLLYRIYDKQNKEQNLSNEDILKYHQLSEKDTVLISPSLMTGVDLADDLARFQIIVKMPYVSMADKRVKHKMDTDKEWYSCNMLRSFIQECGRSTRSENDWSVTYVLDNCFEREMKRNARIIPNGFKKRIVNENNFDLDKFHHMVK